MQDKVVIITGSSRPNGMGAATARLARERGAKVVVHGHTDSPALQKTTKELGAFKIVCDTSDKYAVEQAVKQVIKKFGRVDSLVNCAAAYFPGKPFLELEDDDWYADFNVNLLGVAHFCQAVIPVMKKGSTIVNISSTRGISVMSSSRIMAYSVSKAGVISLTVGLAKEFAPKIRINCVAPGPTETDMAKKWIPELRQKYESENLIGGISQPEDLAKVILFLASDQSGPMAGQVLLADGGYQLYGK